MKTDKKTYVAFALLLIAVLLIWAGPNLKKEKSFSIEDKCGNFMNLVSHTIDSESQCALRCQSQCTAMNNGASSVEFKANQDSCNNCTCRCKQV